MKRLLYIITIGLSLTACDMDKYPLDAVSPDTFFGYGKRFAALF